MVEILFDIDVPAGPEKVGAPQLAVTLVRLLGFDTTTFILEVLTFIVLNVIVTVGEESSSNNFLRVTV